MTSFRSCLLRLRWAWRTRGLGRAAQERDPLERWEAERFAQAKEAYRRPAKAAGETRAHDGR